MFLVVVIVVWVSVVAVVVVVILVGGSLVFVEVFVASPLCQKRGSVSVLLDPSLTFLILSVTFSPSSNVVVMSSALQRDL